MFHTVKQSISATIDWICYYLHNNKQKDFEAIGLKMADSIFACRLIPLDKNPGLQLIGIAETLLQIAGTLLYHTFEMI